MSEIEDLDQETRARFGKSLVQCTWGELQELLTSHEAAATRLIADVDRADAAIQEASCGCPIRVPLLPDGSPDIGRGAVHHTEQCNHHTKETDR